MNLRRILRQMSGYRSWFPSNLPATSMATQSPKLRPRGPTQPHPATLATTIRRWGREVRSIVVARVVVYGLGGPLRSPCGWRNEPTRPLRHPVWGTGMPCWITNRSPRYTRKSLGEKHLGKPYRPGVHKSHAHPETKTLFFDGDRYDMLGSRSMLPALLTAHR